ncbi:MAG: hypothetical protein ACI35O_13190 [Bacillaceae bacterium]
MLVGVTFGQNLQNWLTGEIGAIFLIIIGGVAIYYLAKREFSKFIGFALFAMLVGVFVFRPTLIKDLGIKLFDVLVGG